MPIINKNVQVIFGTGDISAQIGYNDDKSSGVVQFNEIKPRKIGEEFTTAGKSLSLGEAPVTLIF